MKGKNAFFRIYAIAAALIIALMPAAALAAVEATAAADKTSVQAGDVVEVTITVTGKELAAVEGVYTYDPAVLTYTESEGGASDGFIGMVSAEKDGADSMTARISFTAAGSGTVDIAFEIIRALNYDGEETGTAKCSVSVTVQEPPPTPQQTAEPIKGVEAVGLGTEQPMFIWLSLENVTVPSKYIETTLEYHGETVAAAVIPDSDAPTLLYVSNNTGSDGGYYVYDEQRDALYPYQTVNSVSKSYILLEPDGSVALPEGFAETTITVDEKNVPAWVSQDAQGDIYLLYARNPDGEVGYYMYDPKDESLQRYAVMPARPVQPVLPEIADTVTAEETPQPEEDAADEGITLSMPVIYGACGIAAALVITIVAMSVSHAKEKARRRRRAEQRRAERRKMLEEEAKEEA